MVVTLLAWVVPQGSWFPILPDLGLDRLSEPLYYLGQLGVESQPFWVS